MSEEETNIIKEQLYLENGKRASYIDISGEEAEEFIKAVEKLLKENEELKELVGFTTIRIKAEDITMVADKFVSKDKIRDKIKELEKTTAEELRYDFLMNRDEVKNAFVRILKELLEDN